MYHNPSAHSWRCPYAVDPFILPFHQSFPNFAVTQLHQLPPSLSKQLGVRNLLIKDESSRAGLPAFKILGASWATYRALLRRLDLESRSPLDVVKDAASRTNLELFTATDGNHGRAVARMAKLFGIVANVYVPSVMDEKTRALIVQEGATVSVIDGEYDTAVRTSEQDSIRFGGILIQDTAWPGYEEIPQWIVDGYSTMLVEIEQQTWELSGKAPDLIVVPVGVGSLAQAVVSYYKSTKAMSRILTVEPETAACLKTSLEKGRVTTISTGETSMCGMNCGTVSSIAWPLLRDGVDASITVSDTEAEYSRQLLTHRGFQTGPCGAATLAAFSRFCRSASTKAALDINEESTVVLLATEGSR